MKTGSIICLGIFVAAAFLSLGQMWFSLMSSSMFIKALITLAVFFVVVLGITLVKREYVEDKEMKDSGYID
ncbi:MAG: hypothetical protein R8K22_04990 [Mariprofundaceae bacterium]